MRKALILTRNYPPYLNGDASRVWKIASNLPAIGWESVVVAPPAVSGIEASLPAGGDRVFAVHRTGPDIDVSKLQAPELNAFMHGREVAALRPLAARLTGLFRDGDDGAAWQKGAAALVEKLLAEHPEIDMLYAQGPPLEPLVLALETARKHHLTVVLDITAPLDPTMPDPGTSASSAAAREEERILLSGLPMTTTTRALKEYFLKKYIGRLDHGSITIVPPSFDALQTAFLPPVARGNEGPMRIALLVGELPKADLKAAIAGLEAWVRTDGINSGDVEFMPFGEGVDEMFRRTAKGQLSPMLARPETLIGGQPGLLRRSDLFCALLGRTVPNSCTVPERLVDALGLGLPLCGALPEGPASKLVAEARGVAVPAGDASAIAEMFRGLRAAWRSGTLKGVPAELAARHAAGTVIHELTRSIAGQHVR
ncbi:MAG: glycosyltransferase family 4 protein [Chlorobiaceae bacterium]|nr:glycosyltransferase family 4 protein [Chlorobiaceae bacterium]